MINLLEYQATFSKKNVYFCILMARDKIHTPVKEALIQDGWVQALKKSQDG